jgi:FMN-dependent NADH-azoreductase
MTTLLAISASPRYEYSTSHKLVSHFVDSWQAAHQGGQVIHRDLMKTVLPFVDLAWIGGAFTPAEQHSPESAAAIKISNDLVAELQSADHLVIGTPMFNFSIPAVLKAYIDHIVRKGLTATGGDFSPGSPVESYNLASLYLRQVLGYIGITDVEMILAGAARAGMNGEMAVEEFGAPVVRAAAA